MTKTPTAEEVLGLYREWRDAAKKSVESYYEDEGGSLMNAHKAAAEKWERAYQQWQAAQGPYTFEWFVGRFGEFVRCNLGSLFAYIDGVELEIKGRHIFFDHPQRSDVEALVRLLSGKDGE